MAISRANFCFFITAMSMKNRTMGIPALEDGPLVKLLILDYLYIYLCPDKKLAAGSLTEFTRGAEKRPFCEHRTVRRCVCAAEAQVGKCAEG